MGENKYDNIELGLAVIIGIVIGMVFIACLAEIIIERDNAKLGGAICEKEYHQDFDQYLDGKLYCKSKDTTMKYDGLAVVLNGGKDEIR